MVPEDASSTTAAVQHYLDELGCARGASPAQPIVRDLLARSVDRLHMLCSSLLHKSYPRLTRPPLNLQADELLSSVVERLLKSLEKVQPQNVRQFFALANQHMRWELNDLARRLDKKAPDFELLEFSAIAPESSGSELSQNARKMLNAIDNLPEAEREVFGLVRIQGMSQSEAAEIVGVSLKTIQRRLNSSLLILSDVLSDRLSEQQFGEE